MTKLKNITLNKRKLEYEDMPLVKKKKSNRIKSKKVLTKTKRKSILPIVNKAKRKDDKMASDKNKKLSKVTALKSVAWLVEAAFRTFVGWVLITNFDYLATTVAAFYALSTAGLIVVTHFVTAHNK